MSRVSVVSLLVRPSPRQAVQGDSTSRPLPEQPGQVVEETSWPSSDWRTVRSCPDPPQREQVVGSVPGSAPLPSQRAQAAAERTLTSLQVPKTASVKSSCTRMARSPPRRERVRGRERVANGSPAPKKASMTSAKLSKLPKPNGSAEAAPPLTAALPPRS